MGIRRLCRILILTGIAIFIGSCTQEQVEEAQVPQADYGAQLAANKSAFPKIASWLAKKEEVIASGKPYALVMSGWFTPEEAASIKKANPDARLLAGLTVNWVYDSAEWLTFLKTVAGYGKGEAMEITEDMYLKKPNGERCAFGWASEEWGHGEIYAMDPRNEKWVELITSFYANVLAQPQHDGIVVDMVTEWSPCEEAISSEEWVEATRRIFERIKELNHEKKPVIFNAGRDISEIDAYEGYFDGYLMENFLGRQFGADFNEGLEAAEGGYIVIYAVDTDDTGVKDPKRMRLGLTLSLLNDNTYFTYDFGPRDHGSAWWFKEYDADLGRPLGEYYTKDNAYWREFERGVVVASPYSDVNVSFEEEYTDITTGMKSKSFVIEKGDGRIFVREKTARKELQINATKITPAIDLVPPELHSGEFDTPFPLPHPVNTPGWEDSPFITPDGSTLYFWFTPSHETPPEEQLLDGVTGIYVSRRENGSWSQPERIVLGEGFALDGCAFVLGNEMWFCSARQGNYRDVDIYTAEFKDGRWQNVKNAGRRLNVDYEVGELHITRDGREMYFHSRREGGKGGYDIWVTRRVNGTWQEPENVEAVNSAGDERQPFVTQDGGELWFTGEYQGTPAIFRSKRVNNTWQKPELVVSGYSAEPSLDSQGNLYFVHILFDGNRMEADIYFAKRKGE